MNINKKRFQMSCICLTVPIVLFALPAQVYAAGCGKPDASKLAISLKLPPQFNKDAGQGNRSNSIVGLWHVTYLLPDGTTVAYESFDQWHSDGNEFEVADLGPGAMCQGTWKQIAPGTIQLFHVGWNFDQFGMVSGTFTITQTNTVSADGSTYPGTFDLKNYDLNGNLIPDQELTGTLKATRLTVN